MTAIAVDIGGTFTDLVVRDESGDIHAYKTPTTPRDFSRGIDDVLTKGGVDPGTLRGFTHGTTVALNALLERRGAEAGLITTAGFRDVLELMRTSRPHNYDLQANKPVPLIPRHRRREVSERIDAAGAVLIPVNASEVLAAVEELVADGCEALAICFLFAFRNPENEQRAADAVRKAFPDLVVSSSAEITREWREFERTSTTVVNALCRPSVERYIGGLEANLAARDYRGHVRYMQSNGGIMSAKEACRFPVRTLLSGPVGGVIAAEWLAELLGHDDLITLDIGGTSADMALIRSGRADVCADKEIERWPILFSAVDINAVGAGGGSIAWLDDVGALRVGPRSAGAEPGPVCYRRGGEEPTVTDAHLVLGAIDPEFFLGGELRLDRPASERALTARIARPLGMDVASSAGGVVEIVNARMLAALREVSVRRGHDPSDFTLLAFGGGGGLHAVALARELGMGRAVVPVNPAVFSALGMLAAQLKYDFAQTVLIPLGEASGDELTAVFMELEFRCREKLASADDTNGAGRALWSIDARYAGQDHTLPVSVPQGTLGDEHLVGLRERFEQAHQRHFGYRLDDEITLVHQRVTVLAETPRPRLPRLHEATGPPTAIGERELVLGHDRPPVSAPVYRRGDLAAGTLITGPAILEEAQATTIIDEPDRVSVDVYGNLLIAVGGAK
jgi:N-methylhydantoinase A